MMNAAFRCLVVVFCIAWLAKYVIVPAGALAYFYDDYFHLSSECANAMDESWFAEQRDNDMLDKTAQVHLLNCHEYDKTRKIMLSLGISEDFLSYIGLQALEVHQKSAEELVRQHRFRQR
jgi:His-Xaa-Ser system protein (TIGR03982 family)